jgi:hypothetical protein
VRWHRGRQFKRFEQRKGHGNENRPTHRLYAVSKPGNDKSQWQAIGAAWPHKDGKGFNVKLNYLPLNGAEIVIREADTKEGVLNEHPFHCDPTR